MSKSKVVKERGNGRIQSMESILDKIDPAFEFDQNAEEQLALAKYYQELILIPDISEVVRQSIRLNLMAWILELRNNLILV